HSGDAAAHDDDLGAARHGVQDFRKTIPSTTETAPARRARPNRSLSSQVPRIAAKITEVSRSAATAAIGARVMAHCAMPQAATENAPPARPRCQLRRA